MQRRFVELDQAIRLQNNDSNENADQTFATLDNMFYKLFLSFESRFVQLLEQKGKLCLVHSNSEEQIRPKMGISRSQCPNHASNPE